MANKIVQLVDNESNNIFPVAGSMAGDSVTTQMIQDGAVTAAKIDTKTLGMGSGTSWLGSSATFTTDGVVASIPAITINTNGGDILCIASIMGEATAGSGSIRIQMDTVTKTFRVGTLISAHGKERCVGSNIFTNVAAGSHSFQFRVSLDGASSSITLPSLTQYSLTVIELPTKVL